jgi:hypothetical protein
MGERGQLVEPERRRPQAARFHQLVELSIVSAYDSDRQCPCHDFITL